LYDFHEQVSHILTKFKLFLTKYIKVYKKTYMQGERERERERERKRERRNLLTFIKNMDKLFSANKFITCMQYLQNSEEVICS